MEVTYDNFRRTDIIKMFGDATAPGSSANSTSSTQVMEKKTNL